MDANEVPPPPLAEGKGVLPVLKHICDQTLPLFRPPFLKDLMLCVILMVDICLCANTVFLWLPEITNRISVYKESHAADSTLCEMIRRDQSIVYGVTNTTSAPVECVSTINTAVFLPNVLIALVRPVVMMTASIFVPLFDRRIVLGSLLVFGSSIAFLLTVVSNAPIAITIFGALTMVAVLSHNVLCSIVIEIFPTYISAMAVSINNIFGRLGAVLGSQLFSLLIDTECPLLFHLLSGTLLSCSVVPFFFKLQNKIPTPNERSRNTSLSIP
ncbi:hypothetical protein J6590_093847 [Homalodisca vitripennis]|nr:hypothetical protein J6590_093847 [Homalodisca vitripennis]